MATAHESAYFCELVYKKDDAPAVPEGWDLIRPSEPNNTGMFAEAYQNPSSGEVLVVYRGTEPSDLKDLITDGQIILAGLSDEEIQTMQDADAVKFLKQVITETGATDIHATGHSLGDHLAQKSLSVAARDDKYSDLEYSGFGFNGPDVITVGDLANVNYTHIDTRGDLAGRFGDGGIEGNEVILSTGPGAMHYGMDVILGVILGPVVGVAFATKHALDAHGIQLTRKYFDAHPNVGMLPDDAKLTAQQILEIRKNPEGFVDFNDSSVDNEGGGQGNDATIDSPEPDLSGYHNDQTLRDFLNDPDYNQHLASNDGGGFAGDYEKYLQEQVAAWDDDGDGILSAEERAFRDDLQAFAKHNAKNAASESDSDADMHNEERGEGEYDPDSIVGFDDGKPVTYAQQQLAREQLLNYDANGDGVLGFAEQAKLNNDIEQFNYNAGVGAVKASIAALRLYQALDDDNELAALIHGADILLEIDDLGEDFSGGEFDFINSEIEGGAQSGIDIGSAILALDEALDSGNDVLAVIHGLDLADEIVDVFDADGNGFLDDAFGEMGIETSGQILALYNLSQALQDGDIGGIVSAGYQTYTSFGGNGLGGFNGAQTGGFIAGGVALMDGDAFGAALAALNFIPVYGQVLYLAANILRGMGALDWAEDIFMDLAEIPFSGAWILTKLGGFLSGDPPDPTAWLKFNRGEDGEIGFDAGSNETGGGLEAMLEGTGGGLVSYLVSLETAYADVLPQGEIEVDALPKIDLHQEYGEEEIEWRVVGGRNMEGATNIIGIDPSMEDVARGLRDVVLISHVTENWQVGSSSFVDPITGETITQRFYSPFGMQPPTVSKAVAVGPLFIKAQEGGYKGVVSAQANDIRTINPKPIPTATKELADVTKHWRIDKDLFAGERGRLLAMGLAAGLVNIEDVAAAALPEYEKQSLAEQAEYRALIEAHGSAVVAGGGVIGGGDAFDALSAIAPTVEYDVDLSANYTGRRADLFGDSQFGSKAINEGQAQAASENNATLSPPPLMGSSAVTASGFDVRDLADPGFIFPGQNDQGETTEQAAKPQEPEPEFELGKADRLEMLEDREVFTTVDALLANDQADVSFMGLSGATGGTVSLNADGEIHFIPDADFSGTASFGYVLRNSAGDEETITVQVNVAAVNDAADAVDDAFSLVEDQVFNCKQLLANDSDVDGDRLAIAGISQVSHGHVEINSAGEFVYIPQADYVGKVELNYIVVDGGGARSVAHATLTYTDGGNDAPEVVNEVFYDGLEDQVYHLNTSNLLANDSDGEGSALTISKLQLANPSQGSLDWDQATGAISITPAADYYGEIKLNYQVSDADGGSNQGQASVYFSNTTDAFSASDHTKVIAEDDVTLFTADYFTNGMVNPGNDPIELVAVRMVDDNVGRVNLMADGSVQFIPGPDFNGETAFEVRLSNGVDRISSRVDVTVTPESDAPNAVDDQLTGAIEGSVYEFNVSDLIANDVDAEGDDFSLTDVTLVDSTQGQLVWDQSSGALEFTPAADFYGSVDLNYTITETHSGLEREATATIDVANVNDTASISDKSFTLNEDEARVFSKAELLDVLVDADGEALSISAVRLSDDAAGDVSINADGGITFTPAINYAGAASIEYDVFDGVAITSATLDLTVEADNDAPEAVDDQLTGAVEAEVFEFNVSDLIANDSDVEGDDFELTDVNLSDASQGELTWDQTSGKLVFTPAADFYGSVDLNYTITETHSGQTSAATASIDVANVNDTASISDKSFTLNEDEVRVFSKAELLDVLVDADGEALSISAVRLSDPDAGEVSINADGGITFTPAINYAGVASIEYDVFDGVAITSAKLDLTIEADNDAPDAVDDQLTGAVEAEVFEFNVSDLIANDSDVEGDDFELTNVSLSDASQGELTWDQSSGKLVFTPAANVFGAVSLNYVLTETATGQTSDGSAVVNVSGTDDDFVLSDKAITLAEDQVKVFTQADLLSEYTDSNYTDLDGEALTISAVRLSDAGAGAGELVLDTATGEVTFTPTLEYAGKLSFEYDVTDGVNTHTATMAMTIEAVNDAPTAVADNFDAVEDEVFEFNVSDLIANDSDAEGDDFSFSDLSLNDSSQGTVEWDQQSGAVRFTPADEFNGEVSLSYRLTQDDDSSRTSEGVVTIDVAAVNDTAQFEDKDYKDSLFNVSEEEPREFSAAQLLKEHAPSGYLDADGEALTIMSVRMLDDSQGSVSQTDTGGVLFTPATDFNGLAQFEVQISDGVSPSVPFITTVKVWAVNDGPQVTDNAYSMAEDTLLSVSGSDLLADDRDAEGDGLNIVGVWQTSVGVAVYDAQADTINFNPGEDVFGPAWVDYLVEDSHGEWSVARMDVDIANTDDPVIAVDDALVLDEDSAHIFAANDLLANDLNPDQEVLTITGIDASAINHGSLVLLSDGRLSYTPEVEYAGVQSFEYTVRDESGHESTATATLTINEVNDAPIVARSSAQVLEDETLILETSKLLPNISDIEDDWVSIVGARSQFGSVEFDEYTGTIHFTPTLNFNSDLYGGPALLEYLVVDERGAQTWAAVDVSVTAVNDPPVANDDVLFAWESGPGDYVNVISESGFLANDKEVDGEVLHINQVTQVGHAQVSVDTGTGLIHYQADAGFIGTDSFAYQVSDGAINADGSPSVDHATVTVQVMDNHAPIAYDTYTQAAEDTILTFEVDDFSFYDEDLNQLELPENHKIISVGNSEHGQVTINADGSVSFRPTDNYNSVQHGGVASFEYTLEDVVGHQSTATMSINYTPVNDAPFAQNEYLGEMDEDGDGFEFTLSDLLANDSDVDGDSVSLENLSVTHGQLFYVSGETYRYVPDENYHGNAHVNYSVTDGELSDSAYGVIQVNSINDPPWIRNIASVSGPEDTTNTIRDLIGNGVSGDIDGTVTGLEVVSTSGGINASVSGGNINYSSSSPGSGQIRYRVQDNEGAWSETATVNVVITPNPKPPENISVSYARRGTHTDTDPGAQTDGIVPVSFSGSISATDPDGDDAGLRYYIGEVGDSSSDGLVMNTRTGEFTVNFSVTGVPGNYHNETDISYKTGTFSQTVNFYIVDEAGLVAQRTQTIVHDYKAADFTNQGGTPVVLDLTGNGLALVAASEALARYDWDEDGQLNQTGWIAGEGDGILAFDYNGDGVIENKDEISFVGYLEGANTDLEGLNAFDTNGDGRFSANDDAWNQFGLWVDDGDGLSEAGEFQSLDAMGLESIGLTSDGLNQLINGNTVFGMTDFVMTDGTSGQAGDVAFTYLDDEAANEDQMFAEAEEAGGAGSTEGIDEAASEETVLEDIVEEDGSDDTSDISEQPSQGVISGDDDGFVADDSAIPTQADAQEPQGVTQDFDELPDDEELDRLAIQSSSDAASMPPQTSVNAADTNPESVITEAVEEDEMAVAA